MIDVKTSKHGVVITGYQIVLRPIVNSDLDTLRTWRNSESVRQQMLTQAIISKEEHLSWFEKLSNDPSQCHWAIEYKGALIGATNVKCKNKSSSVASSSVLEPGLYIGDSTYKNNILAFSPTLAMYDYCFSHCAVKHFEAEVKYTNQAALNYNEKLGYKRVSVDAIERKEFVELYVNRQQYEHHTVQLKKLLSRSKTSKIKGVN